MKYCFYCGTKLDDDDTYCLNCGSFQDSEVLTEDDQSDNNFFGAGGAGSENTECDCKRKSISERNEKRSENNTKKIVITGVVAVCVCSLIFAGWSILSGKDSINPSGESNNEYYNEYYNDYEYDNDNDYDYSDCIFPYSSEAQIDEAEVYYLTDDELQEAINELYARHGRIFDDEEIQAYFSSKSWYVPVAKGIEKENFNEFEEYNWEILTEERKAREPDDEY